MIKYEIYMWRHSFGEQKKSRVTISWITVEYKFNHIHGVCGLR